MRRGSAWPEPRGLELCSEVLDEGVSVLAFFHSNHHAQGRRFVHTCHRADVQPLLGLSSGWLRARVLKAWRPPSGSRRCEEESEACYVRVQFSGQFRDPLGGCAETLEMQVDAGLVRPLESSCSPTSSSQCSPLAARRPLLSVLIVRWWDYLANSRWSDYAVTNDGFLRDLVDGACGLYPSLGGEFEIYTVFVKDTSDLDKVSAHWAQAALTGLNTVVWYFLWPNQRVAPLADGCVREQQFFSLCQRMERAGLRSGWPHPSSLYRQLCGKLWIPQMSLCKDFRVPPTTRVHYADVRHNALRAAEQAIAALLGICREVWGTPEVAVEDFRGVAKLGFSWQGDDVLPFCGPSNLARVLVRLFEQQDSEQLVCLVQEMVQDVVGEHRVLCFRDAASGPFSFVRERLWLRMKSKGEHHTHQTACEVKDFAMASAKVIAREKAAGEFFGGDEQALDAVEAAVEKLVGRWLLWFSAESSDLASVTRLDFLISRRSAKEGGATAWTCEVGECGASLCSVECDARNCAALNWAIREDPSKRFPMQMPAIRLNNGWKS
ncbi:unnamed protein product [Polarella glacialis]|uniref:Uncharacterized protein n=1 Tax=Polarella glacialis TaxID=89957 RepID=A0A813JZT3_POLGL|nr:unnamed protein product [Polarella glacialis]